MVRSATYPTTGVELTERVAGTLIEFSPRATNLPGGGILQNSVLRAVTAIHLDISQQDEARLFPEDEVGS
jgi:hypothetical protein